MKKNRKVRFIVNNYTGYPFDEKKYNTVSIDNIGVEKLYLKLKDDNYILSEYEKKQIIEMYKILTKEIEDWEWSAVMDESREEYDEFIKSL